MIFVLSKDYKSEEQSGEGKSVLAALPEGNMKKRRNGSTGRLKFVPSQRATGWAGSWGVGRSGIKRSYQRGASPC